MAGKSFFSLMRGTISASLGIDTDAIVYVFQHLSIVLNTVSLACLRQLMQREFCNSLLKHFCEKSSTTRASTIHGVKRDFKDLRSIAFDKVDRGF